MSEGVPSWQWRHEMQFEHSVWKLQQMGFVVSDEQIDALVTKQFGFVFRPVPLNDPFLDFKAQVSDPDGNDIIIPWIFEYATGCTDLFRTLDGMYDGWREWPAFTGQEMPSYAICFCCDYMHGEPEEFYFPVWEALVLPSIDDAEMMVDSLHDHMITHGWNDWFHYWENRYSTDYEPEGREPVVNGFVMPQFKMPHPLLQERWETILGSLRHNSILAGRLARERQVRWETRRAQLLEDLKKTG